MRSRPTNRYELLTCALRGHVLVGTDVATVGEADSLIVHEARGARWHRCLRCDGWHPRPVPEAPTRATMPRPEEIEVPLRGPQLRDRYILRLIALDRALHVVALTGLAVAIYFFLGPQSALRHDYVRIMNALTGGSGGPDAVGGFLGKFRHLFLVQSATLHKIGLVVIAYAVLEATEMVGLWFARRWAEYLTLVATLVFVPLEVYELTKSVTTLKVVGLVLNLAIAAYLLLAKRLFGVRGGHRAEHECKMARSGWAGIESSGPPALARTAGPEPSVQHVH